MVSAKIVLFTSKTLKNGEHPLMIRLTKDRKSKYISTGLSCTKDLWDEKACLPKKKHPNQLKLSIFLNNKLNELRGKSDLGGGTALVICVPGIEHIAIDDFKLEQYPVGALALVCGDSLPSCIDHF